MATNFKSSTRLKKIIKLKFSKNIIFTSSLFTLALGLFLILGLTTREQFLVINEIHINDWTSAPMSELEKENWIEIWNPTDQNVTTLGLQLILEDYTFNLPDSRLAPGEYKIIYFFRTLEFQNNTSLPLESEFSKNGGLLQLYSKIDKKNLDQVIFPSILKSVSFGRNVQEDNEFCYLPLPTPGYENSPGCFKNLNEAKPKFSHESGVYDKPFNLVIESPINEGRLIYTIDGSYPDLLKNGDNTFIYTSPLEIKESVKKRLSQDWYGLETSLPRRQKNEIKSAGVTIRARNEFGLESSGFYLFNEFQDIQLPIVSLIMDQEYLVDSKTGIYTPGEDFYNYLNSEDFEGIDKPYFPANFFNRGNEWERPLSSDSKNSVIFYFCRAQKCNNQNVGLRIHGNASRKFPMKSLRIYAREEYGKARLEGDFFGPESLSAHKRLILRNSGTDWGITMLADPVIHSFIKNFNIDTQNYQPVVLFINGEYWGIHNLRERYDRFYFADKYSLKPENVTVMSGYLTLEEGNLSDIETYRNFLESLEQYELGDESAIELIRNEIDIQNFYDYMIVQTFFAPFDWPTNNVKLWKVTDEVAEGSVELNKWKWVLLDLDLAGHRTIDHITQSLNYDANVDRIESTEFSVRNAIDYDPLKDAGVSLIFAHIISNSKTRDEFFSKYVNHLAKDLSLNSMIKVLNEKSDLIEPEMERHISRWGYPSDIRSWKNYLAEFEKFFQNRSDYMLTRFNERYIQ